MHIARASTYPQWWPGWERIEVEGSDEPRVGARARGIVRSPFGYRLRLDVSIAELERPRRLLTISKGDLAGTGLWEFEERDGTTHARWTWTVESHHPLLIALEPVAKKLFEASHNYVSGQGHAGLRRYLEPPSFDPARVATLEAAGWRAYYAREWSKMLYLMVALAAEQFRMPPREAVRAAYYATRGAVAFKPLEHDEDLVLRCYERFYEIARRHSGLRFRPREAARHEMRYWDVHRRTAADDEKPELTDVLAALHAELFSLSPDVARESAEWRARAAATVDRITSGRSDDVERDWASIDADLRRCYDIVSREMSRAPSQVNAVR